MAYLPSANVKVFPSAYRGSGIDPEARLNSERNLTLSLNSFADYNRGSFVLDYDTTSHLIKFVIGGYYFEATLSDEVLALDNVYAHIKTVDRGGAGGAWACKSLARLVGTAEALLDENSTFYGLEIDNSATQEGCINLKVLEGGAIAAESKLKISSDSVGNDLTVGTETARYAISDLFITKAAGIYNSEGGFNIGPAFGTNKFHVETSSGNTTIDGTLSVTGTTTSTSDFTVGNNKFKVTAASGNTTIGGTLGVAGTTTLSGNTTLNAAPATNTALANGSLFLGNGGTNGSISSSGNGVFGGTGGVITNKLQAYDSNITLASNIMPSGNIGLGAQSDPFQTIFSNGFYVPITSGDSMSMHKDTTGSSYPNGGILESAGTLHLRATSNLHLDGSNNNSKIYSEKKFIANDGIESLGDIKSLGDITIAANKHLDLSGDSTGSIKLKTVTGTSSSTSYTITSGDGIYNITIKVNNDAYSATMALKDFSPVYSPNFTYNGSTRIGASKNGTDWVLTFTYAGDWKVVKIASL